MCSSDLFDILPNVELSARRQPWRVVVTRSGNLPKGARIFTDTHRERTIVYQKKSWDQLVQDLYQRGIYRLLVEGGAKTARDIIQAGKVNEVILYLAPEIAAGANVRVPEWVGWEWRQVALSCAGRDLCLRGTLKGGN